MTLLFRDQEIEDVSAMKSLFRAKRSLLSGHSGSGKSTLVNQLIPGVTQEVKEISGFANKGVHTTTFAELFFIDQLWPDFSLQDFDAALGFFAARERRFGGITERAGAS